MDARRTTLLFSLLIFLLLPLQAHSAQTDLAPSNELSEEPSDEKIAELSVQLFAAQGDAKTPYIQQLVALNNKSLIPTFVLAMRWSGSDKRVAAALSQLTNTTITTWHEAYSWQQQHPEIVPHKSYRDVMLRFMGNIDSRFLDIFKHPYAQPENMRIRLEEIVWGGVQFDGIPSLDNPAMLPASSADYLLKHDLVFGVNINGDARAYPLRIMGWHEMLNDVIGDVPVALAYCTLCGSGILYETKLEGFDQPLVFGSSGLLYRSNKLMFDRQTNSIWNQFSGSPVLGPLASSELELKTRPLSISSWEDWKAANPNTTVLSLDTGYVRDYGSGVTYQDYFASPNLMFPAVLNEQSELQTKDYVFGVKSFAASKAWPVKAFSNTPVINDSVGAQLLVLVGNAETRTVRAYEREPNETFSRDSDNQILSDGIRWIMGENFLTSIDGEHKRARLPGQLSYWFAWDNFLGLQSELYEP